MQGKVTCCAKTFGHSISSGASGTCEKPLVNEVGERGEQLSRGREERERVEGRILLTAARETSAPGASHASVICMLRYCLICYVASDSPSSTLAFPHRFFSCIYIFSVFPVSRLVTNLSCRLRIIVATFKFAPKNLDIISQTATLYVSSILPYNPF